MGSRKINQLYKDLSKEIAKLQQAFVTNSGEVLFRLSSKVFVVLMSLILDPSLFGALILVFVNEAIFGNIIRLGQDRRLLSKLNINKIPVKEYVLLLIFSSIVYYFIVKYFYELSFLYLVIPLSLFSTSFFLINTKNRINNIRKYNKLRNHELLIRFCISPLALIFGIEYFLYALIILYFFLIVLNSDEVKKTFTFKKYDLTEFWRFGYFSFHSAVTFAISGFDKIIITKYFGIEAQGIYSKIFSLVALLSLIYLFLSFIYEPKFYNSDELNKIENEYLKYCYFMLIPASLLIYLISVGLQLISINDYILYILLTALFFTYPYEFAKIYILTKYKKLKTIVTSSFVQFVIIIAFLVIFQNFTINKLVMCLIISKVLGILFLNLNIKCIK